MSHLPFGSPERPSSDQDELVATATEPKSARILAETSLDSITFLFQVLMALALTNGAYIFLTNGGNTYYLRPWSTFTLYGSLTFAVFVVTLIPFAHASVIILKQSYMAGFGGRGLQPIVDFSLLFLEAAIFYTLSHTLAKIDSDFIDFFYVAGAILAVDVLWGIISFFFEPKRKVVLFYAALNSITFGLGALTITYNLQNERAILLALLAGRTIIDFATTYNLLFPDALHRAKKQKRAALQKR